MMDNQVQPTIEVEQVERHLVVVVTQEIEAGTIIEEHDNNEADKAIDQLKTTIRIKRSLLEK